MLMTVLFACMYVHHMCTWCLSGEGVGSLVLELQKVVNHHTNAGNKLGSSANAANALNC